jgi:hypothetical protein
MGAVTLRGLTMPSKDGPAEYGLTPETARGWTSSGVVALATLLEGSPRPSCGALPTDPARFFTLALATLIGLERQGAPCISASARC